MNTRIASILLLSAAASLGACKSSAPKELPPQPGPTTTNNVTTNNTTQFGPGTQQHFEQAVNGQNVIYFDTDRFNIDSADAAALQTQVQYLSQFANVNVTIQGHTDERGTREYNLALGERRAIAAKNYMVSLGVPASRINVVSFGKERPVALGSDEQAWAQNRRAVTVVIN